MKKRPIYLDNHSTTVLDPLVLEAMLPYLQDDYGNAASVNHAFGWEAKEAVDHAREVIAAALNTEPREIVFTSGATESVNLAIKGAVSARHEKDWHVVTCVTEHRAVLDVCKGLERQGLDVTCLEVDEDGTLPVGRVERALRENTLLVSIMHANNEIGVLHDIDAIGALCADREILFHTDATQSVGKVAIDLKSMSVPLLSCSAHKFHGPKGVGVLAVSRRKPRVKLVSQIDGGGHERGIRSGTLNVPGIVGMAKALDIAVSRMESDEGYMRLLRDRLREKLMAPGGVLENGACEPKLPNSLNLAFRHVDSVALINDIPEVAVSTGSACSSADPEPSHVIMALGSGPFGSPEERARCSVRFAVSRFTTEEEVDRAAALVMASVRKLRGFSSVAS